MVNAATIPAENFRTEMYVMSLSAALAHVILNAMITKDVKIVTHLVLFRMLGEPLVALHNQVIMEQQGCHKRYD